MLLNGCLTYCMAIKTAVMHSMVTYLEIFIRCIHDRANIDHTHLSNETYKHQ